MTNVTLDDVMNASFGEASSIIRATFKKTVNIRQYETEVMEISSTLNMEKALTGIERMIVSAALQIQIEYEAYFQLASKGFVTASEFEDRKKYLTESINALVIKGEELMGKPVDYLFKMVTEADNTTNIPTINS